MVTVLTSALLLGWDGRIVGRRVLRSCRAAVICPIALSTAESILAPDTAVSKASSLSSADALRHRRVRARYTHRPMVQELPRNVHSARVGDGLTS